MHPEYKVYRSVREGGSKGMQTHQSLERRGGYWRLIHKKKSINRVKEISIPLDYIDAGIGN